MAWSIVCSAVRRGGGWGTEAGLAELRGMPGASRLKDYPLARGLAEKEFFTRKLRDCR